MANVYCVFLNFCVFCLIFVELSQSNQIDSDQYQYSIESSHNLKYLDNANFKTYRVKRDTNVPASPVTTTASLPTPIASTAPETGGKSETPTSKNSTQHLLGENGAGQRKYYPPPSTNETKIVVSQSSPSSLMTATNANTSTINKSLGAVQSTKETETEATLSAVNEDVIGRIDEPEEEFNRTISEEEKKGGNDQKIDYFQYYNSTLSVSVNQSNEYWSQKKDYIISNILSKSHRRAITVQLKFDFPFYGHTVRNVTVATGGFLYTGEYVHSWLAATQYIAPLMANFDTSASNVSVVKYNDNGTAFTVIWEKVPLQDGATSKPPLFTFSVTLYNTGDITFAYKEIPILIENIKDEKHPVKIGLSDAYIIDKTIYFARRKTIYEYHRVNFPGQDIKNNTVIRMVALPTCLGFKDCASCLDTRLDAFNCTWCPTLNRCSTGTDRKRQQWIQVGCEKTQLKDTTTCPALGTKGNNYATQQPVNGQTANQNDSQIPSVHGDAAFTENGNKTSVDVKNALAHIDNDQSKHNHASFALGILLPIVVIASLVMWVAYAYRNPHTKSGQLLIQVNFFSHKTLLFLTLFYSAIISSALYLCMKSNVYF
ncbi:plexin domain-containing protein 2 [Contarinia nasturtii]|uniref:plexin domain-containing protein 2 n=1 Tax=Contarinia nasturtii TaxID=265458 RepID=UPI0012D414AF|nr:plexin domain-containing protein 2 [Contarinia nasturtii]